MPTDPTDPRRRTLLSDADLAALDGAKDLLRDAVRRRREARSAEEREVADARRFAHLRALVGDPSGMVVAAYLSRAAEPSTWAMVSWLADHGARVLLPVIGPHPDGTPRRTPDWAAYAGSEHLTMGLWGIPQPTGEPLGAAGLAQASLVVMPGLAATRSGDRLGTGGGWYDRALDHAGPEAVTCLLLNDDELLPTLPTQPWDQRVDVVLTSSEVVNCGASSDPA